MKNPKRFLKAGILSFIATLMTLGGWHYFRETTNESELPAPPAASLRSRPAPQIPAGPKPYELKELSERWQSSDFDSIKKHYSSISTSDLTYRALMELGENCPASEASWFLELLERSTLDTRTRAEALGHFFDLAGRRSPDSYATLKDWLGTQQGRGSYMGPAFQGLYMSESISVPTAIGDIKQLMYAADRREALAGLQVRLVTTWDVSTLDFSEIKTLGRDERTSISSGLAANLENETPSKRASDFELTLNLIASVSDRKESHLLLMEFLNNASKHASELVLDHVSSTGEAFELEARDELLGKCIASMATSDPQRAVQAVSELRASSQGKRTDLARIAMAEYLKSDFWAATHWIGNSSSIDSDVNDGLKLAIVEHNAREGAIDEARHWARGIESAASREEAFSTIDEILGSSDD